MPDVLTEALLEMHYHYAIKAFFQKSYGASLLRLLKPSPSREAWVGFDQGWVHIEVEPSRFLEELKEAIRSGSSHVDHFYLGFFLQFKKVDKVARTSKYMPAGYQPPYYRSKLSLSRNQTAGLSQHEALLRLRHVESAHACYACPMLFGWHELSQLADLSSLRCVDVVTAPSGWRQTERHFLTFQSPADGTGLWQSEPAEAPVLGFEEWASPRRRNGISKLSAEQTFDLVEDVGTEIRAAAYGTRRILPRSYPYPPLHFLPESFRILEFGGPAEDIESD